MSAFAAPALSRGWPVGPVAELRIEDGCTACGACLMTCPEQALLASPRRPSVLADRCTGCFACVEVCPRDAIHLVVSGR